MKRFIDCVYLWGQTPGSHHTYYNIPGVNRMTPVEGCRFLGLERCCRVAMKSGPFPPFDDESEKMKNLKSVVWSIIGAGGVHRDEEKFGDLEHVIAQAKKYPNIHAGIMDDFLLSEERRNNFTPGKLRILKKRMREDAGRPLELWTVYYDRELELPVKEYLDVFDVITYWTWFGMQNIPNLEKTLEKLYLEYPGKRFMCGCYMWDYGNAQKLSPDLMKMQLDIYRRHILDRKLEGMIICSNCIADVGIPEVAMTKEFLTIHGNEPVED